MKKRLVEDHPTREKKHRVLLGNWKTCGLVLCENAGFGADLKVKLQKAPPCRFGIDDLFGATIICPPPTLTSGCIPSYSLVQQVLPRVYWGYTTFTTKRAGPLTVGGAILLTRVLQVSTALHSTFTGLRTTGRSLGICLRQARWCSSAVCH